MLLTVDGQLWKQFGSGTWYTVDEVAPGLYAYRYADDPTQGEPSPAAFSGQVEAEGLRDLRPEPEGMERPQGSAGRAKEGT